MIGSLPVDGGIIAKSMSVFTTLCHEHFSIIPFTIANEMTNKFKWRLIKDLFDGPSWEIQIVNE